MVAQMSSIQQKKQWSQYATDHWYREPRYDVIHARTGHTLESKPMRIERCRNSEQAETCDSLRADGLNSGHELKAKQFLWNGAAD